MAPPQHQLPGQPAPRTISRYPSPMFDPRASAPTPASSPTSGPDCTSPARNSARVAPVVRATQRGSVRRLLQALLLGAPWLLAGAACGGDSGDDPLNDGGDTAVGQGSMDNAGSGGTMAVGAGGGTNSA